MLTAIVGGVVIAVSMVWVVQQFGILRKRPGGVRHALTRRAGSLLRAAVAGIALGISVATLQWNGGAAHWILLGVLTAILAGVVAFSLAAQLRRA